MWMPKYAKYLRDIGESKILLKDYETMPLTKEYSLIVMIKVPKKQKNPGSLTIPIQIGESEVVHALSNFG